jgi:hypothetical protein
VTFEYQISITPAQDFGLLADVLEDQYRSLIFPDFEEKGQGVIFVSSARLFLWPVLPSEEISINHFKTILDVEYQLYRSVDSFLLEEVKSGVIGANKSFFILSIEIPDYRKVNKMLLEVPKDKVHVRDHVADILIDDSMIISLLVKSLR